MKNMMKEMLQGMLQEMMVETMKDLMKEMLSPEVAPMEAVDTPVAPKRAGIKELSREEFLALANKPAIKQEIDYTDLDIISLGQRMVKYNKKVNTNIWQYTDMVVKNKYNGRCTKYQGQLVWIFEDVATKMSFLQSFQVKTQFTPEELTAITKYKKDKEKIKELKQLERLQEKYSK